MSAEQPDPAHPSPRHRRSAVLRLLFYAAFVALLLARFLPDIGVHDGYLAEGEHEFVLFGEHSFRLAFLERTADPAAWSRDYYNYGARNPHLAKYLFGAAIHLRGLGPDDVGEFPRWRRPQGRWRRVPGVPPDPEAVAAARRVSALLGAGTCLLAFAVGALVWSPLAGLVAAAFVVTFDPFVHFARFVLTDVPEVFFAMLALWVLLRAVRRWDAGRRAILTGAVASGLAAGIALSVKMRSLLAVAGVGVVYLLGLALAPRLRGAGARATFLVAALVVSLVCAGTVVGLNPYLYHRPLAHFGDLLSLGDLDRTLSWQVELPASLERWRSTALLDPAAKVRALWRFGFGEGARGPAVLLLVLAGGAVAARRALGELRGGAPPVVTALLLWTGVSVAGVLAWTPYAWQRYYLYLTPLLGLLCGAAADALARRAAAAWRTRAQ